MKSIDLPLTERDYSDLKAGDILLLNGSILTGRDAAHLRFEESLKQGEQLPVDLTNQVIYYVGPTATPPGRPIGACGPTSSYRMDSQTPLLLEAGLKGMIGKGRRSEKVRRAIMDHGAVYFAAIGGAAALLAQAVKSSEILCYPELATEAVRRLEIVNFPVIVVIDSEGNDLYQMGQKKYRQAPVLD